jgi:hypothetical protein
MLKIPQTNVELPEAVVGVVSNNFVPGGTLVKT